MIKKLICLLFALTLLVSTVGCQLFTGSTVSFSAETDAFLIDMPNVHLLKFERNENGTPIGIQQLAVKRRPDGTDFAYWPEFFFKIGDSYFTKSTVSDRGQVSMVKIAGKTMTWKKEGFKQFDPYTFAAGERGLYAVAISGTGFDLYHYDLNLEPLQKKSFQSPEGVAVSLISKVLEVEDGLLLLASRVEKEAAYGVVSNHLLRLDKDLNLLEDVDLNYQQGSLVGMALLGDTLYLSNMVEGVSSSGEAMGSNRILRFNWPARTMLDEAIILATPYPAALSVDRERNALLVRHDASRLGYNAWTLVDLDDGTQQVIDNTSLNVPNEEQGLTRDRALTIHNGLYYILFEQKLAVYNPETTELVQLDLQKLELRHPHSLIISD